MKIYTKTGDQGTTALVGGRRVPKHHPRIEAYGTVDELMAHTGYLRDNMPAETRLESYREDLLAILDHLMRLSSHLAAEEEVAKKLPAFGAPQVRFLEERIDRIQATLPLIDKFTLPGGHPLVSLANIARTVCRRCERLIATMGETCIVNQCIAEYINRLSDFFYVLGRKLSQEFHIKEELWDPNH